MSMKGHDWLLLILYTCGGRAVATRIQKIAFLLWAEHGVARDEWLFIPYKYGPWSLDVQLQLEDLVKRGLVTFREEARDKEGGEHTGKVKIYELTKAGADATRRLATRVTLRLLHLSKFLDMEHWCKAGLDVLLAKIYLKYPRYTKRSILPVHQLIEKLKEFDTR